MTATPNTPEGRFMNRIERRSAFLKTLCKAEFGLYLPPDPAQRKHAIENLVRSIARQSELPRLGLEVLQQAYDLISRDIEAMQKVLPHDVQYLNRRRQDW